MSAALHPDLAVHKEAADRPTLTFIDTNLVRLCVMENYFGIYLLVSACDEAIAFTVASVNVIIRLGLSCRHIRDKYRKYRSISRRDSHKLQASCLQYDRNYSRENNYTERDDQNLDILLRNPCQDY